MRRLYETTNLNEQMRAAIYTQILNPIDCAVRRSRFYEAYMYWARTPHIKELNYCRRMNNRLTKELDKRERLDFKLSVSIAEEQTFE